MAINFVEITDDMTSEEIEKTLEEFLRVKNVEKRTQRNLKVQNTIN